MTSNSNLLTPSLITSFNPICTIASPTLDINEAMRCSWPVGVGENVGADVYLMMEHDVQGWATLLGAQLHCPSAFEFFSLLQREQVKAIAERIQANCRALNTNVVALTSFFPEINQQIETDEDQCVTVLKNLLFMALELGREGAEVPVVQLVAGSLICRCEPRPSPMGTPAVYALRGDEEQLTENALDRISQALHEVGVECSGDKVLENKFGGLRFAFELEPGPLYLLRDAQSLSRFCKAIDDYVDPIVAKHVGINLDVSHWRLVKGMTPEWLSKDCNVQVVDKIYHAHISGHSVRGHLGDICLTRVDADVQAQLKEWLRVLRELKNVSCISLELEAAKSMEEVEASVKGLVHLLSQVM